MESVSEPDKPDAEVIAEHGIEQLIVIDGAGFHMYESSSKLGEVFCKTADRQEVQRVMLGWGREPAEVQSATQKIND